MMTTFEQAKSIAQAELNKTGLNDDLVILDEHIEFDDGWVFSYQSREYAETGNEDYFLYGNGPIIVGKQDGKVFRAGSAYDVEHYIQQFKQYIQKPE